MDITLRVRAFKGFDMNIFDVYALTDEGKWVRFTDHSVKVFKKELTYPEYKAASDEVKALVEKDFARTHNIKWVN